MTYDFMLFLKDHVNSKKISSILENFGYTADQSSQTEFCILEKRTNSDELCLVRQITDESEIRFGSQYLNNGDIEIATAFSFSTFHAFKEQIEQLLQKIVMQIGGGIFDPQKNAFIFPQKELRKETENLKMNTLSVKWLFDFEDFQSKRIKWREVQKSFYEFGNSSDLLSTADDWSELTNSIPPGTKTIRIDQKISPCMRAEISMPSGAEPLSYQRAFVSLTLDFDFDYLKGNPDKLEKLKRMFLDISKILNCFYAAVFVRQRMNFRDGLIFEDDDSEEVFFGFGNKWSGIPDFPMWLTWYGDQMKQQLPKQILDSFDGAESNLLQQSDKPLVSREMKKIALSIPDNLLNLEKGNWMGPFGKKS